MVINDESGNLMARAQRVYMGLRDSIGDSVYVIIKGPPSSLDSAVTRDYNGNGYLDAIELYFNKSVSIPADYSMDSIIVIGGITFRVDSIGGVKPAGASGTRFVLYLHEDSTTRAGVPQTNWRPRITIRGLADAGEIIDYACIDGAGPVIWRVIKTIYNAEDRRQDVVTVIFSEPIKGANETVFSASKVSPGSVLIVYKPSASGVGYDTIYNALEGISAFTRMVNDSTLEFSMLNGLDITWNNFVNINSLSGQIYDGKVGGGNAPVVDNRKVQVQVVNALPAKVVAVPNPSGPTFAHTGEGYGPGQLYFKHEPKARDWVRRERAGTVLTFQIPSPQAGDTVEGYIKIYDVIGNFVIQAETKNALASLPYQSNSSDVTYDIYWNGSNEKGMKVAPGVYRTVVYLTYKSGTKIQKKRLYGSVGISY
jgi:hypothetical protein